MLLHRPADIGALVRDRRTAIGLTQAELAARVGVRRLWIGQLEGGKATVELGLVLKTLAAVGVVLTPSVPSPHTAPAPVSAKGRLGKATPRTAPAVDIDSLVDDDGTG